MNRERRNNIETLISSLLYQVEPENIVGLRPGLQDTPRRVACMWEECLSGYDVEESDIEAMLSVDFHDDVINDFDEIVMVKDINFWSFCEHHMCPFFGKVHIGYIPKMNDETRRVIGLSKLPRVVEAYAKRLQVQERLTTQIANAILAYVQPEGVMVVVEAQHTCMSMRGVKSHDAYTVTSKAHGAFFKLAAARMEFLSLLTKPRA